VHISSFSLFFLICFAILQSLILFIFQGLEIHLLESKFKNFISYKKYTIIYTLFCFLLLSLSVYEQKLYIFQKATCETERVTTSKPKCNKYVPKPRTQLSGKSELESWLKATSSVSERVWFLYIVGT
jgi:hypothetical protein